MVEGSKQIFPVSSSARRHGCLALWQRLLPGYDCRILFLRQVWSFVRILLKCYVA